jgi:hypothetical protein
MGFFETLYSLAIFNYYFKKKYNSTLLEKFGESGLKDKKYRENRPNNMTEVIGGYGRLQRGNYATCCTHE